MGSQDPAQKQAVHDKKTGTRAAKSKTCGNCGERCHSGWMIGHDHDADPICSECESRWDASLLAAVKQKRH
jgi:hypothetical protein